ncbi:MAG: hypothetical protein EOP06_24380 [Proteobacteria bacterium]|nr:MAG: hypothetical protein EOP06_24380 [Pseudomonadota bacterium]
MFAWARSADPIQPLTSGVWDAGNWGSDADLKPVEAIQLGQSDIITFHSYEVADEWERRAAALARYFRPILCTEYMGRSKGSTVQTILPRAKKLGVGAMNWGLVAGKTQTYFPWDSWQHPYTEMPNPWFHDLMTADGQPFDAEETRLIQFLIEGAK